MNKRFLTFMPLSLLLLTACGNQNEEEVEESDENIEVSEPETENEETPESDSDFENAAIVYYSLTENTEEVAEEIQNQTGAELFALEPVEAYPRAYEEVEGLVRDQQEAGEFPELEELDLDVEDYDTIFIGSPTWHGYISQPVQSWLIDTDLDEASIAPFFTSGSQPIEDPQADLRELIPNGEIAEELSMDNSPRDDIEEAVSRWLENLEENEEDEAGETAAIMTIDEESYPITLNDSEAAQNFIDLMPLTLSLTDYADTEKVGDFPSPLELGDSERGLSPVSGDITIYEPWGNLALFYEDFEYSDGLVSLGRIDDGGDMLTEYGEEFDVTFALNE